jgi:hypothetical protein
MDSAAKSTHAFLILAHDDEQMLRRLVLRLAPLGAIHVHLDAKTDISTWHLDDLPCTIVQRRIRVFWGDWSAVEATTRLLESALADSSTTRLTLLSGSHYPIVSNEVLAKKAAVAANVIGSRPAPNMPDGSRPEIDYQRRFYRTRRPNTLWSKIKNGVMNRIVHAGRPLDWRSVTPISGMRAGEAYWSLDREFALYCTQRLRSSSPLIDYFKLIVCSDEKVFATLYGEYAQEICLEGTTFSKWTERAHSVGRYPAPLSRRDIDEALQLDTFWFARKFSSTDTEILDWLDGF